MDLAGHDRRRAARVSPDERVAAMLGSQRAVIVDISSTGARVFHYGAIRCGTEARFEVSGHFGKFRARAHILATKVGALRMGPNGEVLYDSRLEYIESDPWSRRVLAIELIHHAFHLDQGAVRNALGIGTEAVAPPDYQTTFIRLEFNGALWKETPTDDPEQPVTGVTIAANVTGEEISMLRATYERSDAKARELMRAFAAASIEAVVPA
jgi:hypothetical protein